MNNEKIRFVILKETQQQELFVNVSQENFNNLNLGFSWNEFEKEVAFLVREGYLTEPFGADNTIYYYNSVLTEKGENCLKNNTWYKKAYKTAKEIKKWISL